VIQTDGRWDPDRRGLHFLAQSSPSEIPAHPHVLLPINTLVSGKGEILPVAREAIDTILAAGKDLIVDSGVFALANDHRRRHGITHDQALGLAPDEIDGFDALWKGYVRVHELYGPHVWGTIELDQGGAVNKRKTRARLHDLGIRPIPVYHPVNDGWDYFDELAETHDRICCGNIVQATTRFRLRLLTTIADRHRAYPHLWVHLLGYTPSHTAFALPIDSCDSSAFSSPVRFGRLVDRVMGHTLGDVGEELLCQRGLTQNDPLGNSAAMAVASYMASYHQRGWRHWWDRLAEEIDYDPYTTKDLARVD
jgi:hypothetical protein